MNSKGSFAKIEGKVCRIKNKKAQTVQQLCVRNHRSTLDGLQFQSRPSTQRNNRPRHANFPLKPPTYFTENNKIHCMSLLTDDSLSLSLLLGSHGPRESQSFYAISRAFFPSIRKDPPRIYDQLVVFFLLSFADTLPAMFTHF